MNKYKYLLILLLLAPFTVLAEINPNNSGSKTDTGVSDDELIEAAEDKKRNRMREGTQITDTIGSFVQSGERWTFEIKAEKKEKGKDESPSSSPKFQILENLMLERVAQTIENTTSTVSWKVDGKITEYRGNNFLILTYVSQSKK
ncbi:MAG: hypothetical protein COA78_33485 [Blastopirellula sp.]|nr:MAG: hypothetical protein COA78_33485 [Blastopirellula sp.]